MKWASKWLSGKESACQPTGDAGSIPRSGRSPGEGHGNPHQYPCLENPVDRGAWQAVVRGTAKGQTRQHTMSTWVVGWLWESLRMQELVEASAAVFSILSSSLACPLGSYLCIKPKDVPKAHRSLSGQHQLGVSLN